jgi:ZIP family zinc transporter
MIEAMAWSLLGASSLLLGALAAFFLPIGQRLLGMIMAFGAGVLISAVAYELVEEAVAVSADRFAIAGGFAAGAVVFYTGALYIDRRIAGAGASGGGLAIVLGAVLTASPNPS